MRTRKRSSSNNTGSLTDRVYTGPYNNLSLARAAFSIFKGPDSDGLYWLRHMQVTCYWAYTSFLSIPQKLVLPQFQSRFSFKRWQIDLENVSCLACNITVQQS